MFSPNIHEQTIIENSQGDYIATTAESFLVDRQAGCLSRHTLKFYRQFLYPFIEHCHANSLNFIREITPDILRRFFLSFSETHNPGGVHAVYRTLRAFFHRFAKEEVCPSENSRQSSSKGFICVQNDGTPNLRWSPADNPTALKTCRLEERTDIT